MLTAIRPVGKQGNAVRWAFLCDCGREKDMIGGSVSGGQTTSCGCVTRPDFTGRKFNMLSVISKIPTTPGRRHARYECVCDCGKRLEVSGRDLKGGQKSCGCAKLTRGGDSESPEYRAWNAMIGRCYNTGDPGFKNYGGRGISVCDEWRASYEMFLGHVGRRPGSEYSIGRIDNDGNYEQGNVRWETIEQQNNNSRHNVNLTLGGETMTAAQWERRMGLSKGLIVQRIKTGMTIERAITKPISKHSDKFLKKHDSRMA